MRSMWPARGTSRISTGSPASERPAGVVEALLGGDGAVVLAVDDQLADARPEGQSLGGRRQAVAVVGDLVRPAAEEADHGRVRRPTAGRGRRRRSRGCPTTTPRRRTVTLGWAPGAPSGSPGRAAAHSARGAPAECPRTATRPRSARAAWSASASTPAATSANVVGQPPPDGLAPYPAVLEVPRQPAPTGQVGAHRVHEVPAVGVEPQAAVDAHHHRVRARIPVPPAATPRRPGAVRPVAEEGRHPV